MATSETPSQDPVAYPVVSVLYCVKCNWTLRASWYQQELLHTFTSKAASEKEAQVGSVLLRPSYTPGTFKIYVKKSADAPWVLVWDRVENGGFPEAKHLKQLVRNIVSPQTKLGHSDKHSTTKGTLVSQQEPPQEGTSGVVPPPAAKAVTSAAAETTPPVERGVHHPTKSDLELYGNERLAQDHKTFCEECLEKLPPTWEM